MRSLLSRNNLAKLYLWTVLSIACLNPTDSLMAAEEPVCKWNQSESFKNSQLFEQNGFNDVHWGHIFCGDINRKKTKATGYHHRENGLDSPTARIGEVHDHNVVTGVYEAAPVYVWHEGRWIRKTRGSSFFPDHCNVTQVMKSIVHAASNITCRYSNGKWGGPSAPETMDAQYCYGKEGSVLVINGYFHNQTGDVATAWPLLKNRQPNECSRP